MSVEIWRIWRVCVTYSFTWAKKTRLGRVSRASLFSCLHRANETLCCRCCAHYAPIKGKFWFGTGPNDRPNSRAKRREPNTCVGELCHNNNRISRGNFWNYLCIQTQMVVMIYANIVSAYGGYNQNGPGALYHLRNVTNTSWHIYQALTKSAKVLSYCKNLLCLK